MKTRSYSFKVVIEEDPFEDGRMAYRAYVPALKGCHTWGHTLEEVLKNIREAIEVDIEDRLQHGEPIPDKPEDLVKVSPETLVTVTILS